MNHNTHHNHSEEKIAQASGVGSECGENAPSMQRQSQKLRIYDIFGTAHRLSLDDLFTLFSHKLTLLWLNFVPVGLFLADPHGLHEHLRWYVSLLVWYGTTYGFVLLYYAAARLTWPLLIRLERGLLSPLLSGAVFTLVYFEGFWVVETLSHSGRYQDVIAQFPLILLLFLMLEFAFSRVALPVILYSNEPQQEQSTADTPHPPPPTADAGPTFLTVGDRKIRSDSLRAMHSEEHYVHITTAHETITIRAKLNDLVDQLPPEEGIRTHRSWWVSRWAEPSLVSEDRKHLLTFGDAECAPIARSRVKDVQDWLDAQRDW